MNRRRSYTNLIVLGVLLVGLSVFLTIRYVNFNNVLLSVGYYDKKVSIISTADIHGHLVYEEANGGYYTLDEVNIQMGMPLMKGIIDEIREDNPDSLLLDSGDLFHGTNEANINEGEGVVESANLMGYDAMVVGNHDFDWGFSRSEEIQKKLNYPMLSANAYYEGKPAFEEYEIMDVGGIKFGIFGLTVPESMSNMNVIDGKGVEFKDPQAIAEKVIKELKEQDVDSIILVSHLGDDLDKELVKVVDGIDLVLAGHHHWLYDKPDKVNNSYIVEAGSYSTHVGVADMYFKDGKFKAISWRTIQSKDRSKADPAMLKVADKYHAIALEKGKEVLASSDVDLNGIRSQVRSKETNLADLITDAMKDIGGADLALLNGGGIRESISKGTITLYDVGKPLPFVNSLVTVEIPGENVYDAIERGLEQWPNGASNGGFLQVSGIEYSFDGSKPAGKRLVSVTMDGKPLDREKIYKVATNDYLVAGGDNFSEFEDGKQIYKGQLLRGVLAEYLKEKGKISPEVEGRINILNQRYK